MLGRIATLVAYKKKPTATFMLRHPRKGLALWAAAKGSGTKRGRKLVAGLAGGAALALVVPVGVRLLT